MSRSRPSRDPDADWQGRLWDDFTLDVAAAHQLVSRDATLVKVIVPAQYAQWVAAGRLLQQRRLLARPRGAGRLPSGAESRARSVSLRLSPGAATGTWSTSARWSAGGAYGIVDDPETGPGVPGPPGGC